nr:hypothetical protein [uncultured Sulfurimonas sp.]
MQDNLKIESEARLGVEKFYEDIFYSENIAEMQNAINNLLEITYQFASKKNNRPNKGLKVFQIYSKKHTTKESKVKKEINRRTLKTYQDYLPQFKLLQEQGYSLRKISAYALKKYKIKVSSETIRKALMSFKNV